MRITLGFQPCTRFTITDIANYTIYVSDNGGAFTAWQTSTTSTSAVYNGQVGHSYGFYSIARDLVGTVEPGKTSAEATTRVNKGTICGPVGPPTPARRTSELGARIFRGVDLAAIGTEV